MVPVPGFGQFGLVDVIQGAVDREGGVRQALHVPLGIGGLGCPAPGAFGRGVGDGLQFAQRVGVAQGVPGQVR